MGRPFVAPELRFWPKVEFTGFCWLWTASTNRQGHGHFFPERKTCLTAHRWSYEFLVGPIPEGLHLDHLCRIPSCVNPDHLEPVTVAENVRRGLHGVLRTRCGEGHELTDENVYLRPGDGSRRCRKCIRVDSLARYHQRMANEREADKLLATNREIT
jgi:hypothetical protein